jgi:hypothetical protein
MTTLNGGCHCGRVRFKVQGNADVAADQCNCSICHMSGYLHMLVEKDAFDLQSGEDALQCYTYNSGIAQHYFCGQCGIKSFYIPRSHPDGVSVNVNCLDQADINSITVTPFDGENWEKNVHKLSLLND